MARGGETEAAGSAGAPLSIPARVSFGRLACRDVVAMKRFYDQFGWPPSQHNDDSFAAYPCGGKKIDGVSIVPSIREVD